MDTNTQEAANINTLAGEQATRRGYELFNVNGDLLATLDNRDLDFVQNHCCTSDCRRIGCEFVGVRS